MNTNETNKVIRALQKEKNKSSQSGNERNYFAYPDLDVENEYDFISNDDVKDDEGEFPVWPLIIPNNCTYNKETGKMAVNHDKPRDKLVPYKPVK